MVIYKILNQLNGKVYIGLTTRTLEQRWKDYIKDYKYITLQSKGYRPIIAAMQKYGIDNFTIDILEDNIQTKEELDTLEIKYIKEYNATNPRFGYNVELGGNGIGKHSEATKRKISEAQIGEKNHMFGVKGKDNKTSKPVLDITTDIIYDSVTIAAEQLGLSTSAITKIAACARGTKTSAYGHIFRYVDDNNKPILVPVEYNIKEVTPIKDLLTERIFYTEEDIAEALGTTKSYISKILLGKIRSEKYCIEKLPATKIKVPKKCKVNDLVLKKYKYLITPCLD